VSQPPGNVIGYARVSPKDQSVISQLDALVGAGAFKVFQEHATHLLPPPRWTARRRRRRRTPGAGSTHHHGRDLNRATPRGRPALGSGLGPPI
jgi:hypothetical protein